MQQSRSAFLAARVWTASFVPYSCCSNLLYIDACIAGFIFYSQNYRPVYLIVVGRVCVCETRQLADTHSRRQDQCFGTAEWNHLSQCLINTLEHGLEFQARMWALPTLHPVGCVCVSKTAEVTHTGFESGPSSGSGMSSDALTGNPEVHQMPRWSSPSFPPTSDSLFLIILAHSCWSAYVHPLTLSPSLSNGEHVCRQPCHTFS